MRLLMKQQVQKKYFLCQVGYMIKRLEKIPVNKEGLLYTSIEIILDFNNDIRETDIHNIIITEDLGITPRKRLRL